MRNLYVDRLRGLASLGVVLSHASGFGFINILLYVLPLNVLKSIAENAYHAVALFFVISGYLITTKILKDREATAPRSLVESLKSFYRDRAARIAPCLILMLASALTLAALGFHVFAVDWGEAQRALWAVFTLQYNHYVVGSKPFPMPPLWNVLWSLSIEEVFYLVFPLLMFLLPRRILIIVLAAIVINGPIHRASIEARFYDYFSNFDLLAIGVLTALVAQEAKKRCVSRMVLRACRWAGITIVLGTFYFTESALDALIWGPEFVATGAAVYLLGSIDPSRPREFVLFKIPQIFGRLSYEVYLFHMFFLVGIGHIYNISIRTEANSVEFDAFLFTAYLLALAGLSMTISRFYSERANRWIRSGERLNYGGAAPVAAVRYACAGSDRQAVASRAVPRDQHVS